MNINTKRGIKNVTFGLLQQLITIAFGLILPRLFLINYGSEVNGLISSITQIYVYVALLEAGVGTASLQALYRTIAKKNLNATNAIVSATNRYYKRTGILYLVAVLLLAAIYPFVVKTEIDKLTVVSVIVLNGLVGVVNYFFQGKYRILLQAEGKTYLLSILSTVIYILTSASKIILIQFGFNIIAVQAAYFLCNMIQMLFIELYIRKHYKWIDLKAKPDYDSIAQKNSVMLHKIAGLVFSNTDVLILTFLCGFKEVSVYVLFLSFFDMVKSVLFSFIDGVKFNLGQAFHIDRKKYVRMFDAFESYYMTLSFAAYTVLYIFMLPFMRLYTEGVKDINYTDPYVSMLFTAVFLLQAGRGPCSLVIDHAEHFRKTQWRSVTEAVINLVVSLVCVNIWGIYGVLFGTVAALLYRTNDIILYVNNRILNRSAFNSYRRWITNLILFFAFALIASRLPWKLDSYLSIVLWGVISAIVVLSLDFIIISVVERDSFNYAFSVLSQIIKERKNKTQKLSK